MYFFSLANFEFDGIYQRSAQRRLKGDIPPGGRSPQVTEEGIAVWCTTSKHHTLPIHKLPKISSLLIFELWIVWKAYGEVRNRQKHQLENNHPLWAQCRVEEGFSEWVRPPEDCIYTLQYSLFERGKSPTMQTHSHRSGIVKRMTC